MNEKKIFNFVFVIVVLLLLCSSITNAAMVNKYRGLCDKYTEQLRVAEERNREFEDRFIRVQETVGRLSSTASSNVTDARGIIETVERLRTEIKELEDCCGSFNQSEYYQYWDSYFGIEK